GRAHALHADRRLALAPLHVAGETRAAHEPLNPLAANAHALLVQIEMHPPRAVAAAAAAVDRPDPLAQPGIDERSLRQWPTLPSVKTRAGDAEHPAHERDRVVNLLRRDETEALHRVSLSFAKKAAAFFKPSRSWRSTRTSRRNARNSSRSSLVRPARSPASIPAWRTHRRSDSEETPKFRAISFSERPLARYSSTASRRNSGRVRPLVVRSPWHGGRSSLPGRTLPTKRTGVHENGGTPTRHGAWAGLGVGALVGILFPPSILVSGALGAGAGGLVGHFWRGMSRGDMKDVGEALDAGEVALVVVGESKVEEALAKELKR